MDFAKRYKNAEMDDYLINETEFNKEIYKDEDFSGVDCRNVTFANVHLNKCKFINSTFIKVKFIGCDLSNSNLENSYFKDCEFIGSKCIGTNFVEARVLNCRLDGCLFKYSLFEKCRFEKVFAENCDFTEASLCEVNFKKFETGGCKFIKTNFFNTPLKDLDFSNDEFIAPILSVEAKELVRLKLNTAQAADMAKLLEIIVV